MQIDYPKFHRNFYHEHSEIAAMAIEQVKELKRKLGLTVIKLDHVISCDLVVQVSGYQPPRPCVSFAHFGFDKLLMGAIRKSEFTTPTGIQSQVSVMFLW